jgi:hypothetical protein
LLDCPIQIGVWYRKMYRKHCYRRYNLNLKLMESTADAICRQGWLTSVNLARPRGTD